MSIIDASPTPRPASERDAAGACALPPRHAEGLELLGVSQGSGHREAPGLARRADGQVLQLTPLLYAVLEQVDGRRDADQIAYELSATGVAELDRADVDFLLSERLEPTGVLDTGDTPAPMPVANPLLALRLRKVVTSPKVTRALTAPFVWLFHPLVVALVLGAFTVSTWWLTTQQGLAQSAREALYEPGLLLAVFIASLASAGFHELGHAAACRYGGGRPGAMGVGLYLLWPAFYTDVSDAYRLDRRARLRVDLGGLYFNAVVAVATVGLWAWTQRDAVLLLFAAQLLQMGRQLLPFLRYDGYHVLSDLTGVPDLFTQMKPTLRGMRPGADPGPLRPAARFAVIAWTLVTVPFLGIALLGMVLITPRLVVTTLDSLGIQWAELTAELGSGALLAGGARLLSIAALLLPPLSIGYLVYRLTARAVKRVWRATDERPARRGAAIALAALLLVLLGWAVGPPSSWRPVTTEDRWTVDEIAARSVQEIFAAAHLQPRPATDAPVAAPQPPTRADAMPAADAGDGGEAVLPPTQPVEAPVPEPAPVVPADDTTAADTNDAATGTNPATGTDEQGTGDAPAAPQPAEPAPEPTDEQDGVTAPPAQRQLVTGLPDPWPFPFNRPPAERAQDNHAVSAVATDLTEMHAWTTDLVVVEPGAMDRIDHRNQAFAVASCVDCVARSAALQIVLLVGDQHRVVIPQNLAVAVNEGCERCDTVAVASQLLVTVTQTPDAAVLGQIEAVLAGLDPLGARLGEATAAELRDAFSDAQRSVLRILVAADPDAETTPTFEQDIDVVEETDAAVEDLDAPATPTADAVGTPTEQPAPDATDLTDPTPTDPAPVVPGTPAPGTVGLEEAVEPEPVEVVAEDPTADEPTGDDPDAQPSPPEPAPTTSPSPVDVVATEPEQPVAQESPAPDAPTGP